MKKIGMFLLGLLAGGLVGSALAILLAPSSGEEIRTQIIGYSNQFKDGVTLAAQTRRKELEMELERLRKPHA